MTKSTRNLTVLVGALAIVAMALAAAFPVWAQDGSSGGQGQGQGGETFVLQDDDTLGDVVSRYTMTGDNLRQFFALNNDLVLEAGQTVNFPAGVNVSNNGNDAGGSTTGGGASGAGDASDTGDDATTGTPTAGADAGTGAGAAGTETPAAGSDAGVGAVTTATPVAGGDTGSGTGATGSDQDENSYVTQEGDILGEILVMMGLEADDAATGGSDASGTDADAQTTGTPTAGSGAGDSGGTGAGATGTETPAAGSDAGAGAGATGAQTTATPSAGSDAGTGTGAGTVTDAQLQEFVTLNSDLTFVDRQTVTLPAGIAVTGEDQSGTGAVATGTPAAGDAGAGAQATATPAAGDQGGQTGQQGATEQYTVQAGETLSQIASRFGITVDELLRLNPDLVPAGTTINVPSQQGSIPQTGNSQQGNQAGQQGTQTQGQLLTGEGLPIGLPGAGFQVGLEDHEIGPGRGVYIVQSGDSLSSIARLFNTSADEIRNNNPGLQGDAIFTGQRLIVPAGENPGLWKIDTPGTNPFERQTQNGENQNQNNQNGE